MIAPRDRHFWRQAFQLFALVAIIFAAYFPILRNGFIWDDDRYIEQNQQLRTLKGLERIWTEPLTAEPQYYPLTHTTLWVEYQFWKLNPRGYHLDNILLHAAGAAALWRILRRLKIPGALLAATLFAVHPLQVESVAWATERKNVLSGLFYFLSLWAYLEMDRQREMRAKLSPRIFWYALSLVLFVAALLSKSVTSTLPGAILVIVWWKKGRIGWRDVYPLLPMAVMGIAMGSLTGWMEKHVVGAIGPEFDSLTGLDRICIAGRAFWFYLEKLVWPRNLMFIYPHWNVDPARRWWWVLFPLSAAGAVLGCWLVRERMGRGLLAAMLLFVGTLTPALGFVNVFPMRFSYVADHFQYLAGVGPIVLAVVAILKFGRGKPGEGEGRARLTAVVLCALVAGCCVASNARTQVYLNRQTLWEDTVARNPQSPMAHNNLAVALLNSGNVDGAEAEFRKAMSLRTDSADWVGMGECYAVKGDFDGAREMYQKALEKTPTDGEPVYRHYRAMVEFQLGTAYQGLATEYPRKAGEYLSQAEATYRLAIGLFPIYQDPQRNLASVLVAEKKYSQAIDECRVMLDEDSDSISARMNMGNAFYAEGNLDSALREYQEVVKLDAANANAMASVGAILVQKGQVQEGIAMLRKALAADPGNELAIRNLQAATAIGR